MSTTYRLGKRPLPITVDDDSEDSDVQVIQVKKPRTTNAEIDGGMMYKRRMCDVLNFLENSPRLQRFVKALLSTLGFDYSEENANGEIREIPDIDMHQMPEQEENRLPLRYHLTENVKENVYGPLPCSSCKNFRQTSSELPETYRKSNRYKDTFVTLKKPQNTYRTMEDSVYHGHERLQDSPKSKNAPFYSGPLKCTSNPCLRKSSKKVYKSDTSCRYSSSAYEDQTVNSAYDRYLSSAMKSAFYDPIDDIQLLADERKKKPDYVKATKLERDKQPRKESKELSIFPSSNSLEFLRECSRAEKLLTPSCMRSSASNNGPFCEIITPTTCKRVGFRRESDSSSQKSNFTTEEVVRIQEKEQYKELLDAFCGERWNRQNKTMKNASVQVNMQDTSNITNNHFKSQPTKQCHDSSAVSSAELIEDDDDQPIILKVKPKTSDKDFDKLVTSHKFTRKPNNYQMPLRRNHPIISTRTSEDSDKDDIFVLTMTNKPDTVNEPHQHSRRIELSKKESLISVDFPEIIFDGIKPLDSKTKAQLLVTDANKYDKNQYNFSENESHKFCGTSKSDLQDAERLMSYTNSKFQNSDFSPGKSSKNVFTNTSSFPTITLDGQDSQLQKSEFNISRSQLLREKTSTFFSRDWIENLKKTMEAEGQERKTLVIDQERQLKEYKKSQASKYAEFKKLFEREEPLEIICLEPEPVLPSLTPEMDDIIDEALAPHSVNDVMSRTSNYTILWKDIDTLSGSNWLNDEIINCYMYLIQERSKLPNYPSVYAFTSFFYPKLKSQGFSAIRRWTRKVDIFSFDMLLVPLHLGVHWCLAVIDFRHKKIQYYDSMDANENCLDPLQDYLIAECADKKHTTFDNSGWRLERMKNIPPQLNGSDCGMFTLKYAEYITRNADINFTQQNMQYFRRKMVYEIIQGQLA